MTNEFAFRWRVIEPWHEPDGVTFFSDHGNIFTWAAMADPRGTTLGQWIDQVAAWGFNAMALYADPESNPHAMAAFARYLAEREIGLVIRRDWNEPELGRSYPIAGGHGRPRTSPLLCPYNPDVRAYWADRIARDVASLPNLAGYRTSAGEFYYTDGAPWLCACAECRGHTGQERTRDAIRLVSGLLAPHGATLFWETCQDDPWGQRQERLYFHSMTGVVPENARIVIKSTYWDYHPGWPEHPLFDVITVDADGRSPYMTSIQQPGEYQGVHDIAWDNVTDWSATMHRMVATGQDGLWVMAIIDPVGWDHALNLVNWAAIATYLRDPLANPAPIRRAWATETYGAAGSVALTVLEHLTAAARGMFEFDGLWTAAHSRIPTLEYLDSHLCGPYRQLARMQGVMGAAFPLDMYSPERAAAIRAEERTHLVFNQEEVTAALAERALAQKDGAVSHVQAAIAAWRGVEGEVSDDAFQTIMVGLERNLADATVFRWLMALFLDWKLGVLSEERIDEALAACTNLHGALERDPMTLTPPAAYYPNAAASFRTTVEQLRRELRQPWLETYWAEHPAGAAIGPLPVPAASASAPG